MSAEPHFSFDADIGGGLAVKVTVRPAKDTPGLSSSSKQVELALDFTSLRAKYGKQAKFLADDVILRLERMLQEKCAFSFIHAGDVAVEDDAAQNRPPKLEWVLESERLYDSEKLLQVLGSLSTHVTVFFESLRQEADKLGGVEAAVDGWILDDCRRPKEARVDSGGPRERWTEQMAARGGARTEVIERVKMRGKLMCIFNDKAGDNRYPSLQDNRPKIEGWIEKTVLPEIERIENNCRQQASLPEAHIDAMRNNIELTLIHAVSGLDTQATRSLCQAFAECIQAELTNRLRSGRNAGEDGRSYE